MNSKVDTYLLEGCGRCSLGGTPECKVHTWVAPLKQLRRILLECGLTEERKWGMPCYTFKNKNMFLLSAFKEFCSINIFNGALLSDPESILEKPGENTQAGRLLKFTTVQQVLDLEPTIKAYIFESINAEKAGLKVVYKKLSEYKIPEELTTALANNPPLKKAFEDLTPGRKRGYYLYFSAPKQSKTREARIKKCIPKIFEGKGYNEYQK